MDQETIIAEMEARAKALGMTMGLVCERAGVHQTTFSRWKRTENNPVPLDAKLGSLNKIADALAAIEAERNAA